MCGVKVGGTEYILKNSERYWNFYKQMFLMKQQERIIPEETFAKRSDI